MRLGATIPNFTMDSTKGKINLYEWMGESWCVLFSHPADFTPVCTTELGRIAVHMPEFEKRGVKVLAHSVDPLQSHVDWVNVSALSHFQRNPR
jgi:peroxidase